MKVNVSDTSLKGVNMKLLHSTMALTLCIHFLVLVNHDASHLKSLQKKALAREMFWRLRFLAVHDSSSTTSSMYTYTLVCHAQSIHPLFA